VFLFLLVSKSTNTKTRTSAPMASREEQESMGRRGAPLTTTGHFFVLSRWWSVEAAEAAVAVEEEGFRPVDSGRVVIERNIRGIYCRPVLEVKKMIGRYTRGSSSKKRERGACLTI
jgi:hypothetical protein